MAAESDNLQPAPKPRLTRRSFLARAGLAAPLILSAASTFGQTPEDKGASKLMGLSARERGRELSAHVVIVGGGLGGCAAALAAARNGLRVILTEETDWIGGQLTQQAVPPDENAWIESFGATKSYLELRQRVRDYYVRNYPLTDHAKATKLLNPGNAWVSRLCHEPRVALAVLEAMLAPHLSSGRIVLLLRHQAVAASVTGDRVESVKVTDLESGGEKVLHAPYFLDATELGDLLPLTGTEFVTGAESAKDTGEPHAADTAQPLNMQGFTMCFAMDYLPGEDHTLDKPKDYDFWRTAKISPTAEYPILSFEEPASKKIGFDPVERKGFWTYRRIIDRGNFRPGAYPSDITIVNWPQNDYFFGGLIPSDKAAYHRACAGQQSLSLLYWLQTEAPRPDGGTGWKGLRLRPDIVGTTDGLAKYPYIRESRRIQAEFTVLEQHVSTELRMQATHKTKEEVTAEPFPDSVGIGSYRIDLHLGTGGKAGMYSGTAPFRIPLGALIPRRMENLLPACKNLGVTHITNGCYRLHPVEWNIGESAGMLAAFCISQKRVPRQVRNQPALLRDFQHRLEADGIRIAWPKDGVSAL